MVRKTNAVRVEPPVAAQAALDQQQSEPALRWPVLAEVDAVMSPARQLQIELEQSFTVQEEPRWSKRRAMVFIAGTSAVLWVAIFTAARALLS